MKKKASIFCSVLGIAAINLWQKLLVDSAKSDSATAAKNNIKSAKKKIFAIRNIHIAKPTVTSKLSLVPFFKLSLIACG